MSGKPRLPEPFNPPLVQVRTTNTVTRLSNGDPACVQTRGGYDLLQGNRQERDCCIGTQTLCLRTKS